MKNPISPLISIVCFLFLPLWSSAQTNISGVINDYTEVTAIDICSNSVTVGNPGSFSSGDRVLLIQMQGASIDQSNSSSFGTVTNYNEAGNYEFATIQGISGSQVTFQNYITRSYNPSASVQLVSVPQYTNVTLAGTVNAQAWNGNTGGIVVFAATGNVDLNGNTIDVSGQGFRGGTVVNIGGPCSSTDYHYDCNSANGANKGESIVDLSCTYQRGRGAAAGAGGGGNGHNNGGAGGANGAAGGQGGCYSSCCNPGIGGYALNYANSSNKTFLGSGGGAGHSNDNANVSGADGGGIVMVNANTIVGSNGLIKANGDDANSTLVDDGVGGGGGAGTVMLRANNYSGTINVETNGGDGGDCSNTNPHGPGGGGGGGVLWVSSSSIPGQISYTSNGGANGSYFGDARNAQGGQSGISLTDLQIPAGTVNYSPLSVSTTKQDVDCNGAANGWVDADVTGGRTPYTYSWSNTSATSDSITDLGPGTYTVTVTDSLNCTVTATETINQPSSLSASISSKNDVSCYGGSDGSATVNASGGVTPYNYAWSTSPAQNGATASNLEAGNYTVTVTDDNNCTATANVTINQPSTVNINTTTSDITCNGGSDGWIKVSINGGSPPYSYNWSSGATGDSAGGLTAGTYDVSISDNSSCTYVATDSVQEPSPIQLSTSVQDVSCNGNSDGSVDLSVNGGVSPYQYSWSNNSASEDLNGVAAGTYSVTLTDNNGCTVTTSATVQEPPPINASSTTQDVSCFNGNDGMIEVSASGGNTPYTYSWSHGPTGDSLGDMSAGSYIVIISDSNNCSVNKTITITQPQDIVLNTEASNPTCQGNEDGTIDLSVSGGTGGYDYSWSTGSTTQDLDSLPQGTYGVSVSDANNCQDSTTVELTEPEPLQVQGNAENITCYGGQDGRISVSTTGGTPSYEYEWSNGETGPNLSNLTAGEYTVTITDDKGCSKTQSYTLAQPDELTVDVQDTFQVEFGRTQEMKAFASENDVTYLWSPADSLSCVNCQETVTSTVRNRTYGVQVTNEDGCTATDSTTVFVGPKNLYIPNAFTPNEDETNDEFNVFVNGVKEFRLKIFNRWGEKLFETRDISEGWDGTYNGQPMPADVYIYHLHIKYLDNSKITNQSGSVTLLR